jgi:AbrB family looped-hinge helix DNA binding protein
VELTEIDEKGRVTIPKGVREQAGIGPGDFVEVRVQELLGAKPRRVVLVPVSVTPADGKK